MTAVVELREWDRASISIGLPTRSDLALISDLQDEIDRKVDFTWTRGGQLQVKSFSWIGVIRLSACTINIRPKYAGNELGVLQMLDYAGGFRALKQLAAPRQLPTSGTDLFDLLCHLLSQEVDALVRDGLLHDYTTEEDSLPVLRGSLRFREQATRRFGQLDVLECRFDEFHADVIENRLLRAGLIAGSRFSSDKDVRRGLRRLEGAFADICEAGPPDGSFYRQRIVYGRRNERYRRAHELALLILDQLGVDDLYSSSRTESFAFLLDMNVVFESFISAVIEEAFQESPWRVSTQKRIRSAIKNRVTGKRYSSIVPDLVMSSGMDHVPFDCKYKLYGSRKLSSADIYQSFLYAYALAEDIEHTRAGLIYPAESTINAPYLGISRVGSPVNADLTGVAVDLLGLQVALGDEQQWAAALADIRAVVTTVLEPQAA